MAKKEKTKKHDTFIDMTAMSDVTVLLLTFFMLTATFKPLEPVEVITPASVSETTIPDYNVMTILVDSEGRPFINIDNDKDKLATLDAMATMYKTSFTEQQKRSFVESTHVGVPMTGIKALLDMPYGEQYGAMKEKGIPVDSADNQLADWVTAYRSVNETGKFAIKADRSTTYPKVNKVMKTLVDLKENRYSLVTTLTGMPDGL